MNDFEIVTMEDASSPEPAPPEVASAPKGRSYEEVINDDTKAEVFSQNGVCYYIKNIVPNKDITQAMLKHGGCVECYTRAKKFCGLLDKNCQPVFLKNVRSKEDGWSDDTELGSFFNVREKCIEVNKNKTNVKFHLVEGGSFPSVNKGEDENGNPFQHVTIFPDKVTSAENVRKYKRILNEINVIQPRMEKICCIDAYDSVKILAKELYRLERPDHWRSVINWITDIQNRWLKCKRYGGPLNFEKWGRIPKIHLCVFALTTGRIEQDENTAVHKDYKQSLQIVELIESGMGIEGILSAMDERTHPDNYMVSQLARNMAKHKVTSKYSISLVWPGEFHDDLDLHLIWYRLVNGRREKISEIYYGGKISIYHFNGNRYETRLDFDANVNGGSAEPAENITCVPFGEYDILVNNFTRRTKHKIIPFTIIIHQEGKQKEIIENVWPINRRKGDKMLIKTHSFIHNENPALEMSTKAAKRAAAVKSEWDENFGTPTSIVPNIDEINIPSYVWDKNIKDVSTVNTFMDMARQTNDNSKKNKEKKIYLSDIEKSKVPKYLSDLLKYMSEGSHTLEIYPRNFAPGYVTKINTKKEVLRNKYSLNHYTEFYKIPNKPTQNGTARITPSWFKSNIEHQKVEVEAFIQFGNNWFMVIKDMCLPTNDNNFPLCGGFHPGKLLPTFHNNHNYQWTYCNTTVLPTVNDAEGTPLIGSFLVSEEVDFILNGQKIKINVK